MDPAPATSSMPPPRPPKDGAPEEPIEQLRADPANPRRISDEALSGLEASVLDFGDISGIVWNVRTGELVCGHQRLMTLQRAGAKVWRRESAVAGYIDHPETGERFGVRIVDWTPQKQRLANLAANNPHIAGEFTEAAVEQLAALEEEASFASLRLDRLQTELAKSLGSGDDDDDGKDKGSQASGAFLVVVECTDEGQQADLLERLAGEGLKVRAIVQ